MRFTEYLKRKVAFFFSGSDRDSNPKITTKEGVYFDARNMSVRSVNGLDHTLEDMGGEVKIYGTLNVDYECICSANVAGHLIEVFCNVNGTSPTTPVRFRIDGSIMVETDQLKFDVNHPLQHDTNDRCDGGELFTTDYKNAPYIWNIQNIIDCYNSVDPVINQTYFSLFNPLLYQVILNTTPHMPRFLELNNIGGGGGLSPGKYSYSIRYADSTGNYTTWSVATPFIPVPSAGSTESYQHPGIKTYGASSTLGASTYAIRIKFRVDNIANYEYMEIRRVKQNAEQPYPFVSTPEKLKLVTDAFGNSVDIQNVKLDIITFEDNDNIKSDWIAITDEEDTQESQSWFSAKTVRYYNNRLVFMNINTESKDIEDDVEFINKANMLGFPIMEKLTYNDKLGHYKPYNQVYYPTDQSGEKTGYAVYFMDDFGARSLAVPIDDGSVNMKNFRHRNRREPMSNETFQYSVGEWKGGVIAADVNSFIGAAKSYCHEVIDLTTAIDRPEICQLKNICDQTGAYKSAFVDIVDPAGGPISGGFYADCNAADSAAGIISVNAAPPFQPIINTTDAAYNPFHPTSDADNDVTGHAFRVNTHIDNQYGVGNPVLAITHNDTREYSPKAFAPNYYAQGVAVWGLKSRPDWAKAASIVKTENAGRIICQGVGFFSFEQSQSSGSLSKKQNEIKFWSPDAETGTIHGGTVTWGDLKTGLESGSYQLQLVSPMGAFTEVYDGQQRDKTPIPGVAYSVLGRHANDVDMVVYIRQLFEDGTINPTYGISDIGNGDGYVSFGRWLNGTASGNAQGPLPYNIIPGTGQVDGDTSYILTAASASVTTESPRQTYLTIQTTTDIYGQGMVCHSQGGGNDFNSETSYQVAEDPQKWCEPFYIINIIATGREIAYGNTTNYIETGNIIKFDSRIGKWDNTTCGSDHSFELVDERWEDCIPNPLNIAVANENRYVYVNGRPWLNIAYKPTVTVSNILNTLLATGLYVVNDIDYDGNPMPVTIYGCCTNVNSPGVVYPQTFLHNSNKHWGLDHQYYLLSNGAAS